MSTAQLRITKNAYYGMIWKTLVKWVAVAIFVGIGVYVFSALTFARYAPTKNMGFIPVKNVSYEGGLIPEDAVLLTTQHSFQDGIVGSAEKSIVPTYTSISRVIAGPYGNIEGDGNKIFSVDGRKLDIDLPVVDRNVLSNEYIVECLEGACKKGSYSIVGMDNIIGTPLIEKYRPKKELIHYSLVNDKEGEEKCSTSC